MRSCDRVDSLLSAYIEEDASPAETRFVDGHLLACGRCRQQIAEVRETLRRVQALPRTTVSDGFTERVLARTHGLEPAGLDEPVVPEIHGNASRWLMPLAAAAALALALLGVNQVLTPGTDSTNLGQDIRSVELAERVPNASGDARPADIPQVTSLQGLHPGIANGEATPIGMAGDTYVLESFTLRQPTGGGTPILTRASATSESKVMVTF